MSKFFSSKKQTGSQADRHKLVQNFVQYWHSPKLTCRPLEDEQWMQAGFVPSPGTGLATPQIIELPVGNAALLVDNLKILRQYTKLLESACHDPSAMIGHFLAGLDDSCTGNVEWFKPMLQVAKFDSSVEASPEALQEIRDTPGFNKGLVQSALLYAGLATPTTKVYELQVANHIIKLQSNSCWDAFKTEFGTWRERGLLYAMLISGNHMSHLNDWLPVEYHEDPTVRAFWGIQQDIRDSHSNLAALTGTLLKLNNLFCSTEPMQHIMHTLDHLCILMRVDACYRCSKDLDTTLKTFPKLDDHPVHFIWNNLKRILEQTMPQSVLAATPFKKLRKSTWVRPSLDFHAQSKPLGVWFPREPLEWQSVSEDVAKPKAIRYKLEAASTSQRLKDVIQRTGTILASPELACAMICPLKTKARIQGESDPSLDISWCYQPGQVLSKMGCATSQDALDALEAAWPTSHETNYRTARHLVAWKADTPQKTILFIGNPRNVVVDRFTPHLLDKVVMEHRASGKNPERIHVASDLHPNLIRDSVLQFARLAYPLWKPLEATVHTTLEEALTCWIREPADLHTKVALNASVQWENDHEDPRYAETQECMNGHRYRDWVTVYADNNRIEKCKLDSHVISFDTIHQTHYAWLAESELALAQHDWIVVSSSLPMPTLVLRNRSPDKSSLEALSTAVKSRFMQDLSILPIRSAGDGVDKHNVNIYTDPTCGQVLMVYAPTSSNAISKRLEFISFKCAM